MDSLSRYHVSSNSTNILIANKILFLFVLSTHPFVFPIRKVLIFHDAKAGDH